MGATRVDKAGLALAFGAALAGAARGDEPPLSPGRVALLVLEPARASAARIEGALASPEPDVRAAAARVAGALAPPSGCDALKAALAREKDAEAAREETRAIESLCGTGDADALRALARARAAARSGLTVREGRGEPRPIADRAPLVRTVADLPRGVATGVAKETGCSLANASLAYAEVTFRPLGTPQSINPRLMPSSEGCRRAALVLFALSLPPGDYVPAVGAPDRLAVVFDAEALAGMDEDPVGAPEARTVQGGVKEPKEVLRVKPGYPESLRRQRLEGAAVLTARIDREGRVKDVRVVEPAGTLATVARDGTSLDLEALRAVARWRYEPARLDGSPVPVLLSVRITWAVSGFGARDASMMRR